MGQNGLGATPLELELKRAGLGRKHDAVDAIALVRANVIHKAHDASVLVLESWYDQIAKGRSQPLSDHTSTLAHTEKTLTPLVWAVWVACTVAGVALLWLHTEPWALLAWMAPVVSNVIFFAQHRRVSVGMTPPAVASLAPAAASALLGTPTGIVHTACVVALVLSGAVIALFGHWFARLWTASHRGATVAEDAVIIVLGGAVVGGRPRPTLALRLDTAGVLALGHPHRTLVLTGGPLHNGPGTEAQAMARYLRDKGIPTRQLLLEEAARNTRENIKNSCALVAGTGRDGQLCVLTSDYHLYRALREGRALGIELVPLPAPTPVGGRLQQWCREVLTILVGR